MRRLSRAKRNVIRRLNNRLSTLCFGAEERILDAFGKSPERPYEEVAAPIGRKLYRDSEVLDIKRKLKALGVKGINL